MVQDVCVKMYLALRTGLWQWVGSEHLCLHPWVSVRQPGDVRITYRLLGFPEIFCRRWCPSCVAYFWMEPGVRLWIVWLGWCCVWEYRQSSVLRAWMEEAQLPGIHVVDSSKTTRTQPLETRVCADCSCWSSCWRCRVQTCWNFCPHRSPNCGRTH